MNSSLCFHPTLHPANISILYSSFYLPCTLSSANPVPFQTFLNTKSIKTFISIATAIPYSGKDLSFTGRILTYGNIPESCLNFRLSLQNRIFVVNSKSPPFYQICGVFFCFSFTFPIILHHSFLHLDVVFPERVRTVSWIILAATSSVPFSPSSDIPFSDNIFRIADALQVIIKSFVRPHFKDAILF